MNKVNGKRLIEMGFALFALAATMGFTSCASSSPITVNFVTPSPLPAATIGVEYSQNIQATGVTGPPTGTYTYTYTGTLPPGLSFVSHSVPGSSNNSVSYAIISGHPTHIGTYNFTLTATDTDKPAHVGSAPYAITVN
jgi:hypothetical protein